VSGPGPQQPPSPPAGSDLDFELLWQHAPGAQLLLDDDGSITAANTTFTTWTGHARESLLGTAFARLLPIGDRVVWSTHCVPQLLATGRVTEASVQVLGADGVRHPALLSAVRSTADGDGPDGHDPDDFSAGGRGAWVSIVRVDARRRRRYEEELLARRREAEQARARIAEAEAGLRALVLRDALTGLFNRAGLLRALDVYLSPGPAGGGAPSGGTAGEDGAGAVVPTVFYIDLDGFKTVNDHLGHASGDQLLRVVADRITDAWRAQAVVARLAGDEFVLLDVVDPAHVGAAADRLLAALARPVVLGGVEVVLTASVGVAVVDGPSPGDGEPAPGGVSPAAGETPGDLLLRRADVAMYRAKATGPGRWVLHRRGDPDPGADRLVLLEQLRTALREDQLRVHYQPRVSLGGDEVRGVEALVRWQHPERGLLEPAHFIDAAERSGLIRELGGWVLQQAVEQTVRWQREGRGRPDLQVSVNVSARQLADPALPARVATVLARAGLEASRLVLEITETALMSQPEVALATLRQLKDLGVLLAVDDFGTGYSSFTYLKRFPVDELKIDRSFVSGLDRAPGGPGGPDARDRAGDAAIVASCVHLAHAMGMVAVAEGVETRRQRDVLTAMGCDQGQGYHFSRPVPADRVPLPRTSTGPAVSAAAPPSPARRR
jgi:PAS domain S-box-containing protein